MLYLICLEISFGIHQQAFVVWGQRNSVTSCNYLQCHAAHYGTKHAWVLNSLLTIKLDVCNEMLLYYCATFKEFWWFVLVTCLVRDSIGNTSWNLFNSCSWKQLYHAVVLNSKQCNQKELRLKHLLQLVICGWQLKWKMIDPTQKLSEK